MSIIYSFDDKTEAIISPSQLWQPVENFPETVVVTFQHKVAELARQMFAPREIGSMHAGMPVPIYEIDYKNKPIAFYQTIIGGAVTAGMMENIIAMGGRKFIFFGSCGALDKSLAEGHLIVPTSAYRDEGASYHYAPASDYIMIPTAEMLSNMLSGLHIPHVKGRTWTTDGFYRETRKNMQARRAEGCITVEMECASIMAVAQFRRVEAYQFLYAADNLDNELWDSRLLGNAPQSLHEKHLKIALEVAIRV